MADDEEPAYDVAVNVHKGAEGYGIYFTQKDGKITVTKLDKNSEAEKAGVHNTPVKWISLMAILW